MNVNNLHSGLSPILGELLEKKSLKRQGVFQGLVRDLGAAFGKLSQDFPDLSFP